MSSSSNVSPRPFRFGVQARAVTDRAGWQGLAKSVENWGYSVLTMPDHFDGQLAPVPALMAAAAATQSLRVGALVFDNDYRHPVVLAQELATIDVLSAGRLEIGLGAGWMATDYHRSGIPYDQPGVRVDRFTEGFAVIKACLGPTPVSFAGEHYTVTEHDGLPKPTQQLPPFLVGGGGPRMLRFAARHADIVGVNPTLTSGTIDNSTFASMTADAVDKKVAWVNTAATAAGRAADIELNIRTFMVAVTDDIDGKTNTMAELTGAPPALIAASPFALIGPVEKIVEDLRQRRQRWGFSYVIVGEDEAAAFAPVVTELAGT